MTSFPLDVANYFAMYVDSKGRLELRHVKCNTRVWQAELPYRRVCQNCGKEIPIEILEKFRDPVLRKKISKTAKLITFTEELL